MTEARSLTPAEILQVGAECLKLMPGGDGGRPQRSRTPFKGTLDDAVAAIFGGPGV